MEKNDIVILNLDRPRELRLTNKVLKRFSAAQKIGLDEIGTALNRYDMLVSLIYEMLRLDDPSLTVDQCDDLLDEVPLDTIVNACAEAISVAFGDKKDGKGDPTKRRKNSVG